MQKKEKLHSQLNTDQLQVLDTSSSTKRRTHQAEFIVCCSLTTMKGNRRAHSKHGKGVSSANGSQTKQANRPGGGRKLAGKVIYLDIKDQRQAHTIRRKLQKLDAVLETFLSKDVDYVISSDAAAKHTSDCKGTAEAFSPISPALANLPSPFTPPAQAAQSPTYLNPEGRLVALSRGQALAQMARARNRSPSPNSVVASAGKLGIKVIPLEAAERWLDKEMTKLGSTVAEDVKKQQAGSAGRRRGAAKCKRLQEAFVKVESVTGLYRPVHKELGVLPHISLDTPNASCPFDGKGAGFLRPSPTQEREGRASGGLYLSPNTPSISHRRSVEGEESSRLVGVPILTAGDLRRQQEKRRHDARRRGYCECCAVKYDDIDQHLKEQCHEDFARDKRNYEDLEQLMGTLPTTSQFLHSTLLRHCAQQMATKAQPPSLTFLHSGQAGEDRSEDPVLTLHLSSPGTRLNWDSVPAAAAEKGVEGPGLRTPVKEHSRPGLKTPVKEHSKPGLRTPAGTPLSPVKDQSRPGLRTPAGTPLSPVKAQSKPGLEGEGTKIPDSSASRCHLQAVVVRRPGARGVYGSPRNKWRQPLSPAHTPKKMQGERTMIFCNTPIGSLRTVPGDGSCVGVAMEEECGRRARDAEPKKALCQDPQRAAGRKGGRRGVSLSQPAHSNGPTVDMDSLPYSAPHPAQPGAASVPAGGEGGQHPQSKTAQDSKETSALCRKSQTKSSQAEGGGLKEQEKSPSGLRSRRSRSEKRKCTRQSLRQSSTSETKAVSETIESCQGRQENRSLWSTEPGAKPDNPGIEAEVQSTQLTVGCSTAQDQEMGGGYRQCDRARGGQRLSAPAPHTARCCPGKPQPGQGDVQLCFTPEKSGCHTPPRSELHTPHRPSPRSVQSCPPHTVERSPLRTPQKSSADIVKEEEEISSSPVYLREDVMSSTTIILPVRKLRSRAPGPVSDSHSLGKWSPAGKSQRSLVSADDDFMSSLPDSSAPASISDHSKGKEARPLSRGHKRHTEAHRPGQGDGQSNSKSRLSCNTSNSVGQCRDASITTLQQSPEVSKMDGCGGRMELEAKSTVDLCLQRVGGGSSPDTAPTSTKKVKLTHSWQLLSNNSMSRLLHSENDGSSFDGFHGDEGLPSDLSYESASEVEVTDDEERGWLIDEAQPSDASEEEEGSDQEASLREFIPTFSSPGKRSDSSWDDACDWYLSQSVRQQLQNRQPVRRSPRKAISGPAGRKRQQPCGGHGQQGDTDGAHQPCKKRRLKTRKAQKPQNSAGGDVSSPVKRVGPGSRQGSTRGQGELRVDQEILFNYSSPQKQSVPVSPLRPWNGVAWQGLAFGMQRSPARQRQRAAAVPPALPTFKLQ